MEPTDRFEYKFLLTPQQFQAIYTTLEHALTPDVQGSPTGSYPVVTLYYDTPSLSCYWDAKNRLPTRRKLRIRVYGSANGEIQETSFVEMKYKVDGRSIKHRLQTSLTNALAIVSSTPTVANITSFSPQILERIQHMVQVEQFHPTCMVRYQREAYSIAHFSSTESASTAPLRVTFDQGIRYRFHNLIPKADDSDFTESLIPEDHRIMELKGEGMPPTWLQPYLNF